MKVDESRLTRKAFRSFQKRKNKCKRFNKWQEHRAKKYGWELPQIIALPYKLKTNKPIKETVNGLVKDLLDNRFRAEIKVNPKDITVFSTFQK